MTHDDNTTAVSKDGQNVNYQELSIDEPGPMVSISAITLGFRTRGVSATVSRILYFAFGDGVFGAQAANDAVSDNVFRSTGPADASGTRPGGGSFIPNDFTRADDVRFLLRYSATANISAIYTSVWGEITYIPPSGGFVFLLNLVGASALPFVGALTDLSHFRRYLSWRERFHPRHTTWGPGEVLDAWRDVRAYRAPRYFLPA
jgi:hypothetical protein